MEGSKEIYENPQRWADFIRYLDEDAPDPEHNRYYKNIKL